jgi:hypothetical protein
MRYLPAILWIGLIMILIGFLFFYPPDMTGFAANYDPAQRTIWGSMFGTVGVGALILVTMAIAQTEQIKRKEKYDQKGFQGALFDEFFKEPGKTLYGICNAAQLDPNMKVDRGNVGEVARKVEKELSMYGIKPGVALEARQYVENHPAMEMSPYSIANTMMERVIYSEHAAPNRKLSQRKGWRAQI